MKRFVKDRTMSFVCFNFNGIILTEMQFNLLIRFMWIVLHRLFIENLGFKELLMSKKIFQEAS